MERWLLVAVLLVAAFPARGRDGFEQRRALFDDRFHSQFIAADKDGSGTLSKEEAQAIPFVMQHFTELDANEDGEISWSELGGYQSRAKAAHKAAMAQRQKAMEKRGMPPPAEESTP